MTTEVVLRSLGGSVVLIGLVVAVCIVGKAALRRCIRKQARQEKTHTGV